MSYAKERALGRLVFHAIRHKSAAIAFMKLGLNAAQILRGHYRASTTDRYTKSAGLYTDQEEGVTALGDSGVGQVVGDLLKQEIPQEGPVLEGL